jgi:hypothetical protein
MRINLIIVGKGILIMSDDFTYKKPDESQYHQTLLAYLEKNSEQGLYQILRKANCSIYDSSRYSERRWNAHYTRIVFQILQSDYETIEETANQKLAQICDRIMPPDIGFDVMEVEFVPKLGEANEIDDLQKDLEEIKTTLRNGHAFFTLPNDILEKCQEMAEAYLYLYVVENSLRVFIEVVAEQKYGENFFDSLNVPVEAGKGIEIRKKQEGKNLWLSVRGNSPLYYLDFKDLKSLIVNNWELFKGYFPEQSWIATKIDELGDCRNLVAHNSFLGKHERDVIRVNFNSIIRQINRR